MLPAGLTQELAKLAATPEIPKSEAIGSQSTAGQATVVQALIPVFALISLLSISVYLFGADASSGANQLALCAGAVVAALIGWRNGQRWQQIEESIISGVTIALKPILILFSVGLLIGSWIMSGTVPTMIYYSLQILDPAIFYAAACLICSLISLSIGSSWTVAGTIGIALIGAAAGMGLSLEITAGATISGAYFGDKMSPLSETTNLAPAVAGTDLFSHIGHMVWTTAPSITIALILYAIIGVNIDSSASAADLSITMQLLKDNFTINPIMLLPVVVLLVMANKKLPPIPTILAGGMLGVILALVFQRQAVLNLAPDTANVFLALFKGVWQTLFDGFSLQSGNATLDDLMTRGGMSSMLTTVWLILCAMVFGAVEDAGTLTSPLIPWNTCGAFMSGTLGVATLAYLPYCFFNLINPLVAILYGYMNIKIAPAVPESITTA